MKTILMKYQSLHGLLNQQQAANLRGFRTSMNPRFEVGILDFMDGIPDFIEKFNTF